MRVRFGLLPLIATAALASGCAPARVGELPAAPDVFSLAGEFVVPKGSRPLPRGPFGGLSGLAPLRDGRELLAICDDRENHRVFRLRLTGESPRFTVETVGSIPLEPAPGLPAKLDSEGITLTENGHMLVSSEGIGNEEPRLPPAIVEYSPDGRYIRQLPIPASFAPNANGPLTTGVRSNAGLESLTVTPDFERLFTASELPLAQDGEADAFAPGGRARLIEYTRRNGTYHPARQFVYEIEALEKPQYPTRFAVNGLVELLALDRTALLALERGYVESADGKSSMNRIQLFRIDISGASDVAGRLTLRGANDVVAVRKTLLTDVNALPGLSPALRNLDNFEGMAWGPAGRDGRRPLVMVSDDNFNDHQMTAFLFFRPGQR
ncbi:MAG TPA: esterase-like activity of phytase family protein [Vicinamibacterales bacterium]|nr:esterase-like activity of phytase family protein [Vicinamibacterales bacterium]